ncbi:MAG: hypothetical protein JWR19_152 [Pedosphaera sp.]|nr:hypothetical protein [Pedosphaera sp.]
MSNSATPKLKEFARRLLVYEAATGTSAGGGESAAFRVCEKMREPLGKLMGVGGFRMLLSRALTLAGAEIPWLRELQVKADGALGGLDKCEAKLDARATAAGEIVLVAYLLGLLTTFIGPALTLRLLQDIWPKLDDLNF